MTQIPSLKTQKMQVGGMDCTSCAMKIEGSLEKLAGVAEVSVVVATGRMTVSYDPQQVGEEKIKQRVMALGYTVDAKASKPNMHHALHEHKHGDGHNSVGSRILVERKELSLALLKM